MTIAEKIMAQRDVKEMTRRAIRTILAINPDDEDGIALRAEFEREYGEAL